MDIAKVLFHRYLHFTILRFALRLEAIYIISFPPFEADAEADADADFIKQR